jgi:hypothetical protein
MRSLVPFLFSTTEVATNCQECKSKTCLVTGEPCAMVEALLRSDGIYGSDYIRPMISTDRRQEGYSKFREIPFSSIGRDKDGEIMPNEDDFDVTP